MDKKVQNKVVMVNSFKGGTGKTSVALSYCVYSWREELYENIYFIDIDRLGTSMSYALFRGKEQEQKGKAPCYFDEYAKKGISGVCNPIPLEEGDCNNGFYAVLLNPVAKRRQDYEIHGRLRYHERMSQSLIENDLLDLLEKCLKMAKSSLFVVDCSPGLSEMELYLMSKFYEMGETENLEVEEVYVTTFDSSQIKKTINCLNDNADLLKREKRKVSIVLNDLHNCQMLAADDIDFIFDWKATANKILEDLTDKEKTKVRYKQFEIEQMKCNMIKNEQHLINNTGAYVLQQEYREEFISINRVEKNEE